MQTFTNLPILRAFSLCAFVVCLLNLFLGVAVASEGEAAAADAAAAANHAQHTGSAFPILIGGGSSDMAQAKVERRYRHGLFAYTGSDLDQNTRE
jgi:hypothetical protein